jgi:hypothetical protein
MTSGMLQIIFSFLISPLCFTVAPMGWGPPNMYDISGSAHFINKCDNGIVIHRNRDPEAGPIDRVQVSTIFVLLLVLLHIGIYL